MDQIDTYLSTIDYENSIIGKKKLSAVSTDAYFYSSFFAETASNGCLNFITSYYYDSDIDNLFV